MKRLERDILLRLREVSKREPLESAISLHQFYGIDIIPFAVELAKVTLMLAKELEVIEAKKAGRDRSTAHRRKTAPARQPRQKHHLRRRALHRMAESRRDHRQSAVSRREEIETRVRTRLREEASKSVSSSSGDGGLLRLLVSQNA